MRALLVHRVREEHWSPGAAAAAGVSVRSAYKWLHRHRVGGRPALEDGSSPHRQPRRTSAELTVRILAARYERRTAWAIAVQLQVPLSTVAAFLARACLNRLSRFRPPEPVRRYERARPWGLVHLDIKPLVRIRRVGHRIHRDRRTLVKGAGHEYVHVAIDDYSRVAYAEVLADQCGPTTAAFLARTVRWFARRGVVVERVLTDNGGAYRSSRFHRIAGRAHIRVLHSRPYHPQTNGKAERFIQTDLRHFGDESRS